MAEVTVTKGFKDRFEAVLAYYECLPEEIEIIRDLARADKAAAIECFESIYQHVRAMTVGASATWANYPPKPA